MQSTPSSIRSTSTGHKVMEHRSACDALSSTAQHNRQHDGDGTDNSGNNLSYFNCIRQGWKKEADCIYTIPTAWIWIDGGVYVTGNKLNIDLSYGLKGSYTVEGAIIIPIFIVMLAIAMKMGLVLYNEMKADSSYEYATDMWLVDDFYNYQVLKEVVNEF